MKKVVLLLVVVFIGFYLFTDPHGLAHVTKSGASAGWHALTTTFSAIIKFSQALVN